MLLLIFARGYLEHYYLLYGRAPLLFGITPLTEFFWGAAFAGIVGPLRDFEFGYAPVAFRKKRLASKARNQDGRMQ